MSTIIKFTFSYHKSKCTKYVKIIFSVLKLLRYLNESKICIAYLRGFRLVKSMSSFRSNPTDFRILLGFLLGGEREITLNDVHAPVHFGGDGYVYSLDCGDDYMAICISSKPSNCIH